MTFSIDTRTRRHIDVRELSTDEVWGEVVPAAVGVHGALAGRGAEYLQLEPITLTTDQGSCTVSVDDGQLQVARGIADAPTEARLSSPDLSRFIQDQVTPMGLAITADVAMTRGRLDRFIAWEPALRALLDGRPVHERGDVAFMHADGRPMDIRQSFTVDDDRHRVAEFLAQAGFLHIRHAFTSDEMAAVADDLQSAIAAADPEAGEAWWATTDEGVHQAVRILDFHERSPALAELLYDPRLTWLAELSGNGHDATAMTAEGLNKPLGVVDGISDLPWHKDCSQGGHSYGCSGLTVGISVTGAGRGSGSLGVVPGSHRANTRANFLDPDLDLEPLLLETETGDLTVHCSCTLHMSNRPTEVPRMVVYTGFGLPLREGDRRPDVSDEQRRAARADINRATDRIAAADGAAS